MREQRPPAAPLSGDTSVICKFQISNGLGMESNQLETCDHATNLLWRGGLVL